MIMRRRSSIFVAALVAIALFAAPAPPAQAARTAATAAVRAVDSEGRVVALPSPARRVVSLSPAATEVLFAVGAGDMVCGNTTCCNYPEAAKSLPKVGGFAAKTISVESIVALKPDLVVSAGPMQRSIEEELARFDIPVFSYDPADFAGIARDMRALGSLTGTPEAAAAAAAAMLSSLEKSARSLADLAPSERPTVFWEMYDDPLMTCGASSFQHAIVEAAGGRDLFSDLPGSWPCVSAEEVIRRAPDYILGADDHGDKMTVAQIASRPGWTAMPAVRSGRVILVPADIVSRPTPRIANGVLVVARALHPDLVP